MRTARWKLALFAACWATGLAAQEVVPAVGWKQRRQAECPIPYQVIPLTPEGTPGATSPIAPSDPAQPSEPSPFSEALASRGESGTQPAASFNPAFFGDMLGAHGTKFVPGAGGRFEYAPVNRHSGGIKAAENESPRPIDRFFYFYNEFSYVNADLNVGLPPINLQRHVVGFEKTFLDGWASFGMRLPVVLTDGGYQEVDTRQFADMTLVTKLALLDNPRTGSMVSTGLLITVPTGQPEILTTPGSNNQFVLSDVLLQPFVGWIYNRGPRLYAHGFSSIVVPTDSRDVTVMFNDFGLGLWLYRNSDGGGILGIVPTIELHVNTALNRRGVASVPIGFTDSVNVTGGGYVVFPRSTLGGAVGFPISSPRPFGVEAMAQYTLRF